jgi:catechol 2,3-dioxygenase-like lactoylglutathione lyase family enzyme
MAGVIGLGHVAIHVSDLEYSKKWYHDNFGFEEVWRYDHPDTGTDMHFMRVAGVTIELIKKGPTRFVKDGVDGTINHLCLLVDDLPAVRERLEANGVEFTGPTVNDTECWPNGELDATMLGPDGEKIQIEQIF